MEVPVYVVTGFLDAGKTTFLNQLLNRQDWQDVQMLLVQFESGETRFVSEHGNIKSVQFSKKMMEQAPEQLLEQFYGYLQDDGFDEVWVEWNGVTPFSRLQAWLSHPSLNGLCKIRRVIHIADASKLENLLGRTGSALPEQIANADFAVLWGAKTAVGTQRARRLLKRINPGLPVYGMKSYGDLYRSLFKKRLPPVQLFFSVLLLATGTYFFSKSLLESVQIPVNRMVNVFLGIVLQAAPFLLIGVLLSAAIEIFVSRTAIERRFPKTLGMGVLAALAAGFCLPVCDCASIPIFRSLVKKGVPLPAAVTFMAVSPVINPVVILSTYYAFSGNMSVVMGRICCGIISAVLIGLIFAIRPPKRSVLSGGALDRLMCACGCYEDVESIAAFRGKLDLFLRHAQAEFFSVGKYLMLGTFVSAMFQTAGTGFFVEAQSGAGVAVSMILMMTMGFALSLCSSSDAVVARSLANQFPMAALMAFLVFGPIIDIKNVMMLSSGFSGHFILRLAFTAFIICFAVVFIGWRVGGV
jgi:uncharacterized membrane protein YraQ (UPF0718 family)